MNATILTQLGLSQNNKTTYYPLYKLNSKSTVLLVQLHLCSCILEDFASIHYAINTDVCIWDLTIEMYLYQF